MVRKLLQQQNPWIKYCYITGYKRLQKMYLDCSINYLVSLFYPPLLPFDHCFWLHAITTFQRLQHLYHLQVCFQGEILATDVDEVFPSCSGVIEISHTVKVSLDTWPGSIDHTHRLADHEDIWKTGRNGLDGRNDWGLWFFVHMDTINILGSIDRS